MTRISHAACGVLLLLAGATPHASEGPAADALTGSIAAHVVRRGDTLRALAARTGVDVETLAADNALNSRHLLALGQRLTIDNRHIVAAKSGAAAIVVNLP